MGIYDRPYMRQDPEPDYGVRHSGWWLDHCNEIFIGLNVVVSLAVFFGTDFTGYSPVLAHTALSLPALRGYELWTLVTYAFAHVSIWSLVFNMVLLWYFGNELQSIYGRANLLWIYLLAILAGSGAFAAVALGTPSQPQVFFFGSQPVVLGTMVILTLWFPRRLIYILGLLPCPLFVLTILYTIFALVGLEGGAGLQAMYAPPVAGAVVGLAFYFLDLRISRAHGLGAWLAPSSALKKLFDLRGGRPAKGKVIDMVEYAARPEARPAKLPAADAARVDALLEKIAKQGKESLTAAELEFLTAASKKYR